MALAPTACSRGRASPSPSGWVTLNVGGLYYQTHQSTLLRVRGSRLALLFGRAFAQKRKKEASSSRVQEEQGCSAQVDISDHGDDSMSDMDAGVVIYDRLNDVFLVDADPKYFGVLLNYLRRGEVAVDDGVSLVGVYHEAHFFGLLDVAGSIASRIDPQCEGIFPLSSLQQRNGERGDNRCIKIDKTTNGSTDDSEVDDNGEEDDDDKRSSIDLSPSVILQPVPIFAPPLSNSMTVFGRQQASLSPQHQQQNQDQHAQQQQRQQQHRPLASISAIRSTVSAPTSPAASPSPPPQSSPVSARAGNRRSVGAGISLSCTTSPAPAPGAARSPSSSRLTWDHIGGLTGVKRELSQVVEQSIRFRDMFEQWGMSPSRNILFYGPPGCGKTLLAQVTASEIEANFLLVKCPELLAEKEKAARCIQRRFEEARLRQPCVLFLDEFECIARVRDTTNSDTTSGGLISQLAIALDAVSTGKDNIFVIAATNRPDILEPALLRPGRFDMLIYIPMPDRAAREEVLRVSLRRLPASPDIDVASLAQMTEGRSGADLKEICQRACKFALREAVTAGRRADEVEVTSQHIEAAMGYSRRSVSDLDVYRYEHFNRMLQQVSRGRGAFAVGGSGSEPNHALPPHEEDGTNPSQFDGLEASPQGRDDTEHPHPPSLVVEIASTPVQQSQHYGTMLANPSAHHHHHQQQQHRHQHQQQLPHEYGHQQQQQQYHQQQSRNGLRQNGRHQPHRGSDEQQQHIAQQRHHQQYQHHQQQQQQHRSQHVLRRRSVNSCPATPMRMSSPSVIDRETGAQAESEQEVGGSDEDDDI